MLVNVLLRITTSICLIISVLISVLKMILVKILVFEHLKVYLRLRVFTSTHSSLLKVLFSACWQKGSLKNIFYLYQKVEQRKHEANMKTYVVLNAFESNH